MRTITSNPWGSNGVIINSARRRRTGALASAIAHAHPSIERLEARQLLSQGPGFPDAAGTGNGLLGIYYDDGGVPASWDNTVVDPSSNFIGRVATRTDPTINFNWGAASPMLGMGADNFSVRWVGQVQPEFSEDYTFYTLTDDGAALKIDLKDGNGLQTIIDDPTYHGANPGDEKAGLPVTLTAGEKYNIVMEMFENGGDAAAMLRWESLSTPKQIIPQTQLYTLTPAKPVGNVTDLSATNSSLKSIDLSWTALGADEIGYRILRSPTQTGTYAEINRVGGSTCVDSTVYPGKTYYYKVVPFNTAGDGTASNIANATIDPLPAVAPGLLLSYYGNDSLTQPPGDIQVNGDFTWNGASTNNVDQTGVINWPDFTTFDSPLSNLISSASTTNFSLRWEGTFIPKTTGAHTFYT